MENKLPTLAELYNSEADLEVAYKADKFNQLMNQQPPVSWVKQHPMAANVLYLPIDKVEYLLRRIFKQYKIEVIGYNQLFNSVAVHVRIHYLHPVTNTWEYHDGLGAMGVQVNKGAVASDLTAIKSDAIMKALPAAESFAIKDAAEKFGKLFGADLNRKDTLAFTPEASVADTFTKSNKTKLGQ